MQEIQILSKNKKVILALGAESAGNFSVHLNGKIYFSQDFGDLLREKNYEKYLKELTTFLKKEKIKPNIILTDIHPDFKTTKLGKELAKKFKAKHIPIQHHLAHIFSQIKFNSIACRLSPVTFYGIALDGTGLGTDEKVWGGEIFRIKNHESTIINIERIGNLENQIMIGGELAIKEPSRILISILSKFLEKEDVYKHIKEYYSKNEFELLYNQMQQNFNCIETSSAGRVLDAVSVLLGFAKNQRTHKHEATYLLEKNSTQPYTDLKPKIIKIKEQGTKNIQSSIFDDNLEYTLNTTHLFKYLVKNIHRDKKCLTATAQLYIAQGLEKIIKKHSRNTKYQIQNTILSGGISNNKIISEYFSKQKNKPDTSKKELGFGIPRGDAGISFGQINYLLSKNL